MFTWAHTICCLWHNEILQLITCIQIASPLHSLGVPSQFNTITMIITLSLQSTDHSCLWIQASTAMSMRSAPFRDFMLCRIAFSYRYFWTTHWSHLQRSSSRRTAWSLKMGPIHCPQTVVRNYHSMLHKIPKECGSQVIRNMKVCLQTICDQISHAVFKWFISCHYKT